MEGNDDLKRILDYALHGTPEIKAKEKSKWLGEFRERVIMGISFEEALYKEAFKYAEEALKDPMAEMLIVNNRIPMKIVGQYMQVAKKMDKEYKSMASNSEEAMGVVVASRRAVDRPEVEVKIKMLPEEFRNLHHNALCPEHLAEIQEVDPDQAEGFRQVTFADRMMGIKCAVCQHKEDGGPLM